MPRNQEVMTTWTRGAPRWSGDTLHEDTLMRGPNKVVAADFPLINGKRFIKGGTLVGRTYAEKDAGTGFGPWTTGDEEVSFVAFDILDADRIDDVEVIKPHIKFQIKRNYLPVALNASQLAAARAAGFDMINGTD